MAKGFKEKKPFYKKWWVWLIAILIIGSVANMEETEPTETAVESNEAPVEAVEEVEAEEATEEEVAEEEAAPVEEEKEEAPPEPTYSNPILELDDAKVAADIKADAEADWPDDFMMQDFQEEEQLKAYEALKGYEVDSEVEQKQMQIAMDDWGTDYMMIQFQYDEQMKAFNN